MAASKDHSQYVTHAHLLLLLGWVGMTIYAVIYRLWPAAGEGSLPRIHAIVADGGLIGMIIGLSLLFGGNESIGDKIAAAASVVLVLNMALFVCIVWRGTRDTEIG